MVRRAPGLDIACLVLQVCYFKIEKVCCAQTLGGRTVVADWAVPKAQFTAAAAPPPGMAPQCTACSRCAVSVCMCSLVMHR